MSDEPAPREQAGKPAAVWPPPEWQMLAHVVVLWCFAVLQPTLSVLSHSVAFFFPLRRIDGWQFVAMLAAMALVPPALLWLLGALIGRGRPRLRGRAQTVTIGALGSAMAVYILREAASVGFLITIVVGIVGGVVVAALYSRVGALRSVLTVLTPAPAVFLISFLFFTNASHLVFPGDSKVAAGQQQSGRPTPIVLLVLDELPVGSLMAPDEKIDAKAYPNLARLAGSATWYRTALSVSWTTFTAVPAILSGRRPAADDLPVLSDHPENLFTLMRKTHTENVIESFTRLCPLAVCPNTASLLQRFLALTSAMSLVYVNVILPRQAGFKAPNPGNTWSAVLAALDPRKLIDPFRYETADLRLFPGPQFERFLSLIRKPGPNETRPPLFFLHSNLPHNPYNHLPSGKLYRDHDKEEPGLDVNSEQWTPGDVDGVLGGWERHLLQTQYADKLVGELIDRLKQQGLYDESTFVVVADHGAHFLAGQNRRKPQPENMSDIAMVPLFVKAPFQKQGKVVDDPVATVDVLPTIAELAHVSVPWRVDGIPLDQAGSGAARKFTLLDDKGDELPLDVPRLLEQRKVILQQRWLYLPEGPQGLYGIGPALPLMGKPVSAAAKGAPVAAHVRLTDAGEYAHVDLAGPFVPALVRARVTGRRGPVTAIAVAINGVFAGSSYLRGNGDGTNGFSLMVPESAFHQGRNDVQVLGVSGKGPGLKIHDLTG